MTDKTPALVSKMPLAETPLCLDVAGTCGVPTESLITLMKKQIVGVPKGAPEATDAEMFVVLSVMRQYKLSPMLRHLHAWRDKKGRLCSMVGIDGWIEFAKRQETYLYVGYEEADKIIEEPGGNGMPCPEWIRATVYDTRFPESGAVQIKTWLREWYVQSSTPWQKYTTRRLQEKAFCNAIRDVYGMSVMDDIDAEQVKFYDDIPARAADATEAKVADLDARAKEMKAQIEKEREEPVDDAPPVGDDEPTVEAEIVDGEYEEVVDAMPEPEPEPEEEPEPADDLPERSPKEFGIADGEVCCQTGCSADAAFRCDECMGVYCLGHRSEHPGYICAACGISKR